MQPQLIDVLKRAHAYRGASFVEILQNCIVYNDGVFDQLNNKKIAAEHQLWVEHGQPLVFGKARDKGLRIKPGTLQLEVIQIGEQGLSIDDVLVHDETDVMLATLLTRGQGPQWPTPLGVLYCDATATPASARCFKHADNSR